LYVDDIILTASSSSLL
jgi:hypothetical protein